MQNLFQQSSLTFGKAKQYVAEQAGKQQTTEMLDRAGRSIQSAIQDWNKFNWKWTLTSATITADASGNYQLPYDIKDVYAVTTTGDYPQWVPSVTRRQLTRANARNLQVAPYSYDLFSKNNSGVLRVVGGTATDLTLEYYRRMTVPCTVTASGLYTQQGRGWLAGTEGVWAGANIGNPVAYATTFNLATATSGPVVVTAIKQEVGVVSDPEGEVSLVLGPLATARNSSLHLSNVTALNNIATASATVTATVGGDNVFLDIPESYEWGILARAVVHFMAGVGGPADKMAEWKQQAATALEEALRDDREQEDTDISFMPAPPIYPYNPNRIY